MNTKTRLDRLEQAVRSSPVLDGEPERGENLLQWMWECMHFYYLKGFIDVNGDVVSDKVVQLHLEVQARVNLISGIIHGGLLDYSQVVKNVDEGIYEP